MVAGRAIAIVRLVLGLLLAPALVPGCSLVVLVALTSGCNIDCPAGLAMLVLGILSGGTLASYGVAVVVGLPYVLWMQERGELDFWTLMAPVLGLIVPLCMLLFIIGAMADLRLGVVMFGPALGSVLAALCFYLIVVWRSPVRPWE